MILSAVLKRLSGRDYGPISLADLGYLLQKGAGSFARGAIWASMRLRRPRGLFLGRGIKFVGTSRLTLGRGVSLGHYSYLDCSAAQGVVLGNFVTIREFGWLQCRSGLNPGSSKVRIGDGTYIGPFCVLGAGGALEIGEKCQIGARFTVSAESHVPDERGSFVGGHIQRKGVAIGRECWIGNNVCILDGVRIGDRCVIGAGSVVTRDIPAGSTAFGAPARVRMPVAAARPPSA